MAAEGISIFDLIPAKGEDAPKPKVKSGGIPVASLVAKKPEEVKPSTPGLISRSTEAVKKAVTAYKAAPEATIDAAITTGVSGAVSMINLAASGVAALAKSMVTKVNVDPRQTPQQQAQSNLDQSVESFTSNQKKIEAALTGVNSAPQGKEEEAMAGLLNILPDAVNTAGETVYEKTGSALAGASAVGLATLLTLSPDIATRVLGKVGEVGGKGVPPSKISGAFDELAAKAPETAQAVANHINQVDPTTAKKLHARIQKYIDASDDELSIIGRNAADAAIKELEGNYDEIKKQGTVGYQGTSGERYKGPDAGTKVGPMPGEPGKIQRDALGTPLFTPERVSSTIRTAAKEGTEAIAQASEAPVPMNLSKEERAAHRERIAALRDHEMGARQELVPEPVPRLAAEREGEVARRNAVAANDGPPTLASYIENATRKKLKVKLKPKYPSSQDVGLGAEIKQFPGNKPKNPDIVYFNNGIPVTRDAIVGAFKLADRVSDAIPGVPIAKAKMARLYEGYISTFNPEAKGAPARTAGAAIASNFFEQAHREHVVWQQGKTRRTYWQKMGESASMQFIHDFEKGKKFSNPEWEKARLGYKGWAEQIFRQDMKTGFTYDPVDHYMPHLFKDGDGVLRFMQKRYGNRWADPRFIKERGYDLYQEAIDAGFTPKHTSPEEIMQARQQASDIAALRTDLLADLERKGVAVKSIKGSTRPPDGFSPNSRRSPTGQRYWVREEADALMHNAFDSKSLWQDRGLKGSAFRGYMELKNKIVPIKLMASLFHPMHVIHIDAAAELTRASKLAFGNPSLGNTRDFMLSMATATPFTPGSLYRSLWDNPKTGYPVLRVFQGKRDFATLSDSDKAAYKDLAEGGLVPTRPMEETSGAIQKFHDAVTKRSASVIYHAPFAAIASLSHPMYNVWIPTLKIASYLKDAKVWRELNPSHTVNARQEAFRQIAKKVESRYGEMNYNSMFMDKTIKDIGVATNLSLGWNIGLLDQYVGGAIDLGRAGLEKGSLKEKLASGRLDRPVFAAYYVSSALMIGGLMHYMFTGKQPQQLIDYTHPESGEVDQYGKPIRLNTMFYTREFEGLYKHMEQQGTIPGVTDFILNKGSGLGEMMKAALTGVNSLGNEIRDPTDPAYKQVEQTLMSEFAELEPISLEAINKSTSSKLKMGTLSGLGFTPAGKYISDTVMEGQISNAYNKYVRPKEKPFKAVQMAKDVKGLREAFMKDDPAYDEKLESAIKDYDLSDKDVHKLEKMFNSPKEQEFDPSIFMFSHLPWEVQKPMLDKMTPDERDNYLPHLSKQKRAKYARETDQ